MFFEYGEFEKEKLPPAAALQMLIFQLQIFASPDLFFERQPLKFSENLLEFRLREIEEKAQKQFKLSSGSL